jgi:dTDP-4-dehydrorhamnose reductase
MASNVTIERGITLAQPELWAGFECTVCRIGDSYVDQSELSGHAKRPSDIDRLAALGITALRYPVLWERTEREPAGERFRWSDERLARIRERGVRAIVGLLHHGSGPPHTSLVDPNFPRLFAEYAAECAERYPWVEEWCPVNEPLTTARFSALYGHWYPHLRDDRSFVLALLNQVSGISRAMAAIRAKIPGARLIQTEDLGRTWSTPALAGQAAFENERRWLTFDLLTGRMTPEHPLWGFLVDNGADRDLLDEIWATPCPPDVLGVNYYISSERFLDHRLENYPAFAGGSREYADVEAVRAGELAGPQRLLEGAWARYRLPLAVTEVQLGCTREEQLRWLRYVWEAAVAARARGADVRAVTPWAALGAFDWDSLLTRPRGHYESGLFDVRGSPPRPTALAHAVSDLSRSGRISHPAAAGAGWWQRSKRFLYAENPCDGDAGAGGPPVLITGRTGVLGQAFERACRQRGLCAVVTSREDLDITDPVAARAVILRTRPWAIINTAGYVRVDAAEQEVASCFRENELGSKVLAQVAAELGLPLVTFSTDLVFDGRRRTAYCESDAPAPLGVYGRSKLAAENAVRTCCDRALVIRTAAFFSAQDSYNFLTRADERLRANMVVEAYEDVTVSPTYVPDLAAHTLDLLIDGETGIWHLTNAGARTWYELALLAAEHGGHDPLLVRPVRPPAYIPEFTALTSERARLLPTLENALARFHEAFRPSRKRALTSS